MGFWINKQKSALRKKCLYSEYFWSAFSRIWTEYGHASHSTEWSSVENKGHIFGWLQKLHLKRAGVDEQVFSLVEMDVYSKKKSQ